MKSNPCGRLLVVTSRLPFEFKKGSEQLTFSESNARLVVELKSYFKSVLCDYHFTSTHWIGIADFEKTRWIKHTEKNLSGIYNVEPLFIEKKTHNKFYNGFCNSTLWPLFHYFPSFVQFDNETFNAYDNVNALFAEKVQSIIQPGDTIWIHDYPLLLLPELLRAKNVALKIGFFLHIPFPSYEVFRLLPKRWKRKILEGLLGADIIGFQTHEYVQHFLKNLQMIIGVDSKFRSIYVKDRHVKAEMFPRGIDYDKFHDLLYLPDVIDLKNKIRQDLEGKKILFSLGRLNYTDGIVHRLYGFERFLEKYPEWRVKMVFVLVVIPSGHNVSKYNERKQLIEELIGKINGTYSTLQWQPIIYRYSDLSLQELTAVYNVSHVGLFSPLREGMNLTAKEFIASKEDQGVLILSELTGEASEMGEALLVNPMDKDEVSEALNEALTLPDHMQRNKIDAMQKRLRQYTVLHWLNDFFRQLDEVKQQQYTKQTKNLSRQPILKIHNDYKNATRRLILLDYDGTLVPFSKNPGEACPNEALLKLLADLAADTKNDVAIISGRDSATLERWLGKLPINLVSEHGAGVRLINDDWKYSGAIDQSWKSNLYPLLETLTMRTPGSSIEDKTHTLVWHYRNVETQLGFIRSRELVDNLHHMIRNSNLQIVDGNKVVEVRVAGVDKGAITKKLTEKLPYNFIIAFGDDKTDEDMFTILNNNAYTIKIGGEHTAAQYYLPSHFDVIDFLGSLIYKSNLPEPD